MHARREAEASVSFCHPFTWQPTPSFDTVAECGVRDSEHKGPRYGEVVKSGRPLIRRQSAAPASAPALEHNGLCCGEDGPEASPSQRRSSTPGPSTTVQAKA